VQQEDSQLSVFSLAPTLEDRSIGFFVANYVLGMNGPSRGHLDYLADIARRQTLDEGLVCSMKAVGLAGYAHSAHAPSLMKNARYQYMRALQSTNLALRDPESAKKDTTLISIMILSIFETITGCKQSSLKDWAQHINGASALIKLRGPDQIKTPAGRRMLIQIASNLMIYCLNRGSPVPRHIREYMDSTMAFFVTPDPALVVCHTMMKFCSLRSDVMHKKITDPYIILTRALELDGILLNLSENAPSGWEIETIFTDEICDLVWNGRYHVYYDYWIAQIWNALRVVRIMVHELIRGVLIQGFSSVPPTFNQPEHSAQFQISTDTLYELQADVLYSVVQHIGYFPKPTERFQHSSIGSKKLFDLNEELSKVRMSGGSFLLWPLWLAGAMDLATEEVRDFVTKNLRAIGDGMGIAQAHILADFMVARSDVEVWNNDVVDQS
jgi:hypothetical protein